jgi:hypothetical protein
MGHYTNSSIGYIDSVIMGESHLYAYPTCRDWDPPCKHFDPEGLVSIDMTKWISSIFYFEYVLYEC